MTEPHTREHDHPGVPSIKMYNSGIYLDLLDPKPDQIRLTDVAYGLSRIYRFIGQTAQPYSVAEHSIVVHNLVTRRGGTPVQRIGALFHDAPEYALGDVSGPLKHSGLMEDYKTLELRWERCFEHRLGISHYTFDDPLIRECDLLAFDMECAMVRDNPCRKATNWDVIGLEFLDVARRLGVQEMYRP